MAWELTNWGCRCRCAAAVMHPSCLLHDTFSSQACSGFPMPHCGTGACDAQCLSSLNLTVGVQQAKITPSLCMKLLQLG